MMGASAASWVVFVAVHAEVFTGRVFLRALSFGATNGVLATAGLSAFGWLNLWTLAGSLVVTGIARLWSLWYVRRELDDEARGWVG